MVVGLPDDLARLHVLKPTTTLVTVSDLAAPPDVVPQRNPDRTRAARASQCGC